MPSRDITLCDERLQRAWEYGKKKFGLQYPNNPQPILTCTYRSNEEQAKLYAQGRTTKGAIVTYIKSGGKHNQQPAEAFDIAFVTKNKQLDWSAHNFQLFASIVLAVYPEVKWGGHWKRFKDLPHFEV